MCVWGGSAYLTDQHGVHEDYLATTSQQYDHRGTQQGGGGGRYVRVCGGGVQLTLPTNMANMRIPSDHQSAV